MDIEELKKQISATNKAYRDGHPTMSDQAFDDLCEELEKSIPEEEYAAFRDALNEGKGKVKHPFIMGSLDKLKYESPEEVIDFIASLNDKYISISAKVDGISCRLHYEDNTLKSASTRGDGSFGVDITDKIKYVNCIPKSFGRDPIDVRGELVIFKDDFEALNENHNGKFANPRNAVAGLINQKEWNADDIKHVTFVAYTILGPLYCKDEQFDILKSAGFNCAWNIISKKDDVLLDKECKKLFEQASQMLPYETDGLVICGASYRNEDKYRPDKCKAFKINQLVAQTRLIDVVWEGPSKDGYFCPVGLVDPIELGGSTISRVSCHNIDIIEKLGLMYGSTIEILKSGDVIPHIERVVENDSSCSKIELPMECPCCGSKLVRDGISMRCINKKCSDQVVHRLTGFIKKLGVKSASNATLKNFGLTSFEKLIAFTPDKKYKSEVKLYDELYAKVFSQSKEKLLCAMNFVGLSEISIGKIVSHYGYDVVASSSFKDTALASLPNGIGQTTLNKFIEDLPEALEYVNMVTNDVRWHYVQSDLDASSASSAIKGSICVTGSLNFGSRSKFLEFAKQHGYESKSGVSKGLTYLVNNDISSNSSKNRKAKELGIKILSETDFMKLVEGNDLECSLQEL